MSIQIRTPKQVENRPQKTFNRLGDEQLIRHFQQRRRGYRAAFATLIARHRCWILKVCLARLHNHADAQDVSQDVMLRVYQSLDRFEGRANFRTWLSVIVKNQCTTFAVQRNRRIISDHIEALILIQEEMQQGFRSPKGDDHEQVNEVLTHLSVQTQQVLDLRFFKDYTLEEISNDLGISLSAAKMRLYRGMEQFKSVYITFTNDNVDLASTNP